MRTVRGMPQFIADNAGRAGCWIWPNGRDKDGYGRTKLNGKGMTAHRAAYLLTKGDVPAGMLLCHRCDNRPCCNPDHLFVGTQRDNCLDAKSKDRHSRGMRNGISKFTDDDIRAIRKSSDTQWNLARRYGVWQGTISAIKRRTRWAHVQD